jgi:hypothetical protein
MTHPTDPRKPAPSPPSAPLPPAERERVVDLLTQHYAHDRLTDADLEQRLDRVYQATTAAELAAILAGLPTTEPDAAAPAVSASPGQRIRAVLSGQERKVTGLVPQEVHVQARLGYVELDLREAAFAPGVTHIDVRAFMGYVQIRFPAGVRVESDGQAFAGYFAVKGTGDESAGCVVRVTGRARFGFAECHLPSGRGGRALPGRSARRT